MTQDEKKQAVAKAALEFVEAGTAVGVGTGMPPAVTTDW